MSAGLSSTEVETLRVIHIDGCGAVVGITEHCSQAHDRVAVSLRKVIADALRFDAHVLVFAHNHPSGDPEPSRIDIDTTRAIARIAAPLGIRVHDHVVTGGTRSFSFRSAGLI